MLHFHVEDDNPWVGLNKKVLLKQGTIENVVKKLTECFQISKSSSTILDYAQDFSEG